MLGRSFSLLIATSFCLLSCTGGGQVASVNVLQSNDAINMNSATQYFVSPTGNDTSGDGSIDRPWQSVQHALETIPFDQDDVSVNLRAGTYVLPTALELNEQRGGSTNGVFTIKSFDGETAILDGRAITDFGAMVSITGAHYVALQNLELTNLIGNKSGIHVTGASSNITIANNTIHDMHWTSDAAAASAPAPTDNVNPIVIVGDNIQAMTNISVSNNKVYNLTTGYSEAIKVTGNVDGFLVDNNKVFDISNIGIVAAGNYAWVGLRDAKLNQARNGIIRNNETYRCVSPVAASAGIYVDGALNIAVLNNHSHHNTVGISIGSEQTGQAKNITVGNNIATDNSQAGIVIGTITDTAMVDSVSLVKNDISGNYTTPVWGGAPIIINKSQNVSIKDNAIESTSQYLLTVTAPSENISLSNNRYASTSVTQAEAVFSWIGIDGQNYFGFESYKAATGQDADSTFANVAKRRIASLSSFFK